MPEFSLLSLGDIWLVLCALGGYQLFLQVSRQTRKLYPEGFVRTLQHLTGIPALGSLVLFLLDPDSLGFAFTPMPIHSHGTGLVLFNIAALVIAWSHITLGHHWSAELETHSEHKLIDTGPYALVRHPLYSSYLVLTIGFFFATANWFVSIFMFAYFLSVAARAQKEEEMLSVRLGLAYGTYCKRTPRFVPSLTRRQNQ